MNNDLISRSALKEAIRKRLGISSLKYLTEQEKVIVDEINNAPTVEEAEKPFITECRETAIKENLPLYFIYYEETGVLEVYVTKTKELFEKRHCSKHLSNYEFNEIVTDYLDWYLDWKEDRA